MSAKAKRWPVAMGLGAVLALLSGCNEYSVHTTVLPDGGGLRRTEVTLDTGADQDTAAALRLFGVEPGQPWHRLAPAGKSLRFVRETRIARLEDWPRDSGPVLRGATGGYPAEVRLDRVDTVVKSPAAGGTVYEFRERLAWQGLKERVVNIYADAYVAAIAADYPGLDPVTVAEVRGVAIGNLACGWAAQFEQGDSQETEKLLASLTETTVDVLGRAGVAVDRARVAAAARRSLSDEAQGHDDLLSADMPWLDSVVGAAYRLQVRLPGSIQETNGKASGDTVSWEVDLADAAAAPVELRARSLLAGP